MPNRLGGGSATSAEKQEIKPINNPQSRSPEINSSYPGLPEQDDGKIAK
jgi:hypothetical protein